MPDSSHSPPPAGGARLVIQLADLPPEGRQFQGLLPASVFDLESEGPQPVSPLRYRLYVQHLDDRLNVEGEISADFSFQCVRCLEPFTDRLTIDGYQLVEEIGPKIQSVDLTDRIREDMLLALPGHPRCEDGSLHPRSCPAAEAFPNAGDYSPEHSSNISPPPASSEVWGALDQLDLKTAPTQKTPSRRPR